MIKSFSLFQDTQLWDRNPHKQGDTANISTQPNIPKSGKLVKLVKLVNLVNEKTKKTSEKKILND